MSVIRSLADFTIALPKSDAVLFLEHAIAIILVLHILGWVWAKNRSAVLALAAYGFTIATSTVSSSAGKALKLEDILLGLSSLITSPASLSLEVRQAQHFLALLFYWSILSNTVQLALLGPQKAYKRVADPAYSVLRRLIPGLDGIVGRELEKELEGIRRELLGEGDKDAFVKIPDRGLPRHAVLAKIQAAKAGATEKDAAGQKWGGIYHEDGSELTMVQNEAFALFNCTNTLYPGIFPGVRKFEAEIISMTLGILGGHEIEAVGLLTSGGTESILVAMLAYREQGRHRGIADPEVVCGVSAHPALVKACHYFGIRLVKTELNLRTGRMDVGRVRRAVSRNTVAIYASAPTFAHGVVDPIQELAELAVQRGIGLHVDNCLGGYLLSYMSQVGVFQRPWDFRVPGVTTMSVDVHKYGFASKGCSVVCFRDNRLRRASYVPSVDGLEGLYVTPTLQGARSGAVIAQAWATLLSVGQDGYARHAAEIVEMVRRVKTAVGTGSRIPELRTLVEPDCAIVPLAVNEEHFSGVAKGHGRLGGKDIYKVASVMEEKGWNLFTGQHPPVMSICFGEQHRKCLDRLLADLEASVEEVRRQPGLRLKGSCAVYGSASAVPDAILDSILRSYCDIRMQVKPAPAPATPTGGESSAGAAAPASSNGLVHRASAGGARSEADAGDM